MIRRMGVIEWRELAMCGGEKTRLQKVIDRMWHI